MPGPAEHQPLVRHDVAIDAADLGIFTGFVLEADPIASADANIEISVSERISLRPGNLPSASPYPAGMPTTSVIAVAVAE